MKRKHLDNDLLEFARCARCGKHQGEHVIPSANGKKIMVLLCPALTTTGGYLDEFAVLVDKRVERGRE